MTTAESSSVKVFTKPNAQIEAYPIEGEPVLKVKTATYDEDDPSLAPLRYLGIPVQYICFANSRAKIGKSFKKLEK